ncbi:phosphinothricin N-acetyltransferase [Oxobacter pfennigii]|uniref:Phosphinothricin N-acetyltransferase n=1 Tax=Oxobacter pfennigii TaxID=36849 RepID=A0A0P8W8F3_9CLOT|nr:GNAT family N-acetyltransferase [Oxobacter pfennigii]KPU44282.1 phosphinothricin N-acetyltransferase [Oxobacter pfennigii]
MDENILIRMASSKDAKEILDIYAPYIRDTAITFEYDVPTVDEFAQRIKDTLKMYPYIVAIKDGNIAGYAYASEFKKRAAYDWAVETSIYLKQGYSGKGLGKKLYLALEEILKKQNIINLNACIAYASAEDAHLGNTSMKFHEHLGYKLTGHFNKCGYKFGTWYDIIWMEKIIGEHFENPAPVIPITQLKVF